MEYQCKKCSATTSEIGGLPPTMCAKCGHRSLEKVLHDSKTNVPKESGSKLPPPETNRKQPNRPTVSPRTVMPPPESNQNSLSGKSKSDADRPVGDSRMPDPKSEGPESKVRRPTVPRPPESDKRNEQREKQPIETAPGEEPTKRNIDRPEPNRGQPASQTTPKSKQTPTQTQKPAPESIPTAARPGPETPPQNPDGLRLIDLSASGDSRRPLRNCVAVDTNGRAFVCSQNRLTMMLKKQNEYAEHWSSPYETGGTIPGSPTIGPDGNVRIHSSDGKLHVVTPAGEPAIEPVYVGEPLGWATPIVDRENNTWVCSCNGGLLRIDRDGNRSDRPYFRSRQRFDCTGALRDGVFYVGAEDNCVYAIDLSEPRGKNLWDHEHSQGRTGWYVNSAPATRGDLVIVASGDNSVYAFQSDGNARWSLEMPGQMLGSPVVDSSGAVYVGVSTAPRGETGRGRLIRLDPSGKRIDWSYEEDVNVVESTPVIGDDGTIYFGDNAGNIHAVGRDGRRIWRRTAPAPARSAGTILPDGQLVFGLDDGRLAVLPCDSKVPAAGCWSKYMGTLDNAGCARMNTDR